MHRKFSVRATPEKFQNAIIISQFGFVFQEKTPSGKSRDCRDVIVFENSRFQNVFLLHFNVKPAFSNSSGLKSAFEKLCSRDGQLVWTVGLTVKIKLRFHIPPA